jgi:hypothetical protein
LEQFTERHLLEESSDEAVEEEPAFKPSPMTRREMVLGLSLAVSLIPVVESIVSPPAALAASFGCSGATQMGGSTPCVPVV